MIESSDRNCPRCGKRMMVDLGAEDQDERPDSIGYTRMVHECWHCDYYERDEHWPRPKLTVVRSASGRTMSELLRAQRDGVLVPLEYDTEPFPLSEFDEEVADARRA